MPTVNIASGEPFDVLIDRKTFWGNPYVIGRDGTREEVIAKFRASFWMDIVDGQVSLRRLAALDGKRLGCHCAPEPCHGDVLLQAARWATERLAGGFTSPT